MKLTLTNGINDIVITANSEDPDEVVEPKYEPESELLLLYLGNSTGYYGHLIDPMRVTTLDLYSAVTKLNIYELKEATGVPEPNKLPRGVVS